MSAPAGSGSADKGAPSGPAAAATGKATGKATNSQEKHSSTFTDYGKGDMSQRIARAKAAADLADARDAARARQQGTIYLPLVVDEEYTMSNGPKIWAPGLHWAIQVLLIVRIASATMRVLSDSDEVLNYWDPLYALLKADRYTADNTPPFKAWEYEPQFALRSWAFLLQFWPFRPYADGFDMPDQNTFITIRAVLGFLSAIGEGFLYESTRALLGNRVAQYLLVILFANAALFDAAPALLPSSYAMYFVTFAWAAFVLPADAPPLSNRSVGRVLKVVFAFAVGGVLGWPFAAALGLPFVVEELVLRPLLIVYARNNVGAFLPASLSRGIVLTLAVILAAVAVIVPAAFVDTLAYGRTALGSANIVLYNFFHRTADDLATLPLPDSDSPLRWLGVYGSLIQHLVKHAGGLASVSSSAAGPDLYGTEPASFYVRTLALGFNVLVPLALGAVPLVLAAAAFIPNVIVGTTPGGRGGTVAVILIRLSGPYIWLVALLSQAHKEERFLYPIYTLLAFNAAVGLWFASRLAGAAWPKASTYLANFSPAPPQQPRTILRPPKEEKEGEEKEPAQKGWLPRWSQMTPALKFSFPMLALYMLLSWSRIMGVRKGYGAVQNIVNPLWESEAQALLSESGVNIPNWFPHSQEEISKTFKLTELEALEEASYQEYTGEMRRLIVALLDRLNDTSIPTGGRSPRRTVCWGDAWHRYPGRWNLPPHFAPEWTWNTYEHQLPAHFPPLGAGANSSWPSEQVDPLAVGLLTRADSYWPNPATRAEDGSVNALNEPVAGRTIPPWECDYIVDTDFTPSRGKKPEGTSSVSVSTSYASDHRDLFATVQCDDLLDRDANVAPKGSNIFSRAAAAIGRAFFIPLPDELLGPFGRKWADVCLLKRVADEQTVRERFTA